jgi:aminopeptidase N
VPAPAQSPVPIENTVLTETEAKARAALIAIDSYDVSLDLTASPVRSHAVVRFRCARPGATTFADLAAALGDGGAVLNGVPLRPADDGRLILAGLAANNVLTVDAEVREGALTGFAAPDGGRYVFAWGYPAGAPELFCCFDQLDLPAPLSLSLRVPDGWTCVANGTVAARPGPGEPGTWRFAPVRMKPLEFTFCAGPLRSWPAAVPATGVRLASHGRADLTPAMTGYLASFRETCAAALGRYERELGVPCAYRDVDLVALPDVPFRAACVPGLLVVGEELLARLADPDDDFAGMIAAHEVAHLWFGGLVGMRWWDDRWLEESLATYLSHWTDASWAAFAIRDKPRALRADQLPTTQPVSSPVATLAQALDRPNAITYVKGTAAVRQLAALIGADTVREGLADYLTRFADAGCARLDDLVACWSRAAGRDLGAWVVAWLREPGTPHLAARLTRAADGTIASLAVTQDLPRPQRVSVVLYDDGPLRRRRADPAELAGTETELPAVAGQPLPAAVFANAGDWALAHVTIDDRSLAALAAAAFDVGDPLTEAACWNAAWDMVLATGLAPAGYAALVARRLARGGLSARPLAAAAAEALLSRAVTCADRYVRREVRPVVREAVAAAAFRAAEAAAAPLRRALLAGFAAAAETDAQLTAVRGLLDGERSSDLTLRAALVRALASRGRATPADLAALAGADPVAGQAHLAVSLAASPDPAAKEAAWHAALDAGTPQFLARAHAEGFWVAGQEQLTAGYRDRYFAEALAVLSAGDARGDRRAPRLAGLLFPVTHDDETTLGSVSAALDGGTLTGRLRAVLQEQEAELRTAIAIKAAAFS